MGKWKLAFTAIWLQLFYNIIQKYSLSSPPPQVSFCQNLSIQLVVMATEMLNFEKYIYNINSSEAIKETKLNILQTYS